MKDAQVLNSQNCQVNITLSSLYVLSICLFRNYRFYKPLNDQNQKCNTMLVFAWEVRGWVGSHEMADKGYVNTENSQMVFTGVIFTSTYHTKKLNPWPNSSASHVVNYSQLYTCQGDRKLFKDHQITHRCLTSLRNKS